ncbi:hypothetical protein SAMN05216573_12291 [Bradyrhizobium sp. Rc3b]|nr:hypothetical protein SAMN05216573_12291 [Bradyrhizobium sp. Rc3b]
MISACLSTLDPETPRLAALANPHRLPDGATITCGEADPVMVVVNVNVSAKTVALVLSGDKFLISLTSKNVETSSSMPIFPAIG